MVQNLDLKIVSDTSVYISWSEPTGRVDIIGYEVELRRYEADDQFVLQRRLLLSSNTRGQSITSLSE